MDGDPRVGWLLLEIHSDDSITSTPRRVEYDIEETVALISAARDDPHLQEPEQRARPASRFRKGGVF